MSSWGGDPLEPPPLPHIDIDFTGDLRVPVNELVAWLRTDIDPSIKVDVNHNQDLLYMLHRLPDLDRKLYRQFEVGYRNYVEARATLYENIRRGCNARSRCRLRTLTHRA